MSYKQKLIEQLARVRLFGQDKCGVCLQCRRVKFTRRYRPPEDERWFALSHISCALHGRRYRICAACYHAHHTTAFDFPKNYYPRAYQL